MRICSLLPIATEILYALGLGDQVVGVSHTCDYPAEARSKPVVTHSLRQISHLDSRDIDAIIQFGANLPFPYVGAEAERWLGKPVIAAMTAIPKPRPSVRPAKAILLSASPPR